MPNNLPSLQLLPPNKTVVFYCPVEGRDVLVRTGVIKGSDSLYHSILHSYSTDYVSMSVEGRIKYVKKLTDSRITMNKWEN